MSELSTVSKVDSLKSTIILPVAALVVTTSVIIIVIIHDYLEKQRLSDANYRSEIIAYSVQYTAEIAGESPELNRSVQALGTEKDVSLITVVSLDSKKIIASNRFGWREKSISSVDMSEYHQKLFQSYPAGHNKDIAALQQDNLTYTFASFFPIASSNAVGNFERAIVIVDLNTSKGLADVKKQLRVLVGISLLTALLVIALIYMLLMSYVFKPLDTLKNAIIERSKGNAWVSVAISRADEIGMLGTTFNDLIKVEENTKRTLQEHEEELKVIFDNVPVRIWYKDDKNTILRLNERAAESMGMSVAEVEGKNTADLFPEMAAKYLEDDLEVINSGKPKLDIIERYTPVAGKAGWVKTDKVPYVSSVGGGSNRGVLVVAQDISALKQTEEELRASEIRSQLVISATRDGIWDWPNMAEDHEYWSPQWKALLGYEEDEIEAKASTFFSMLHPQDRDATELAIARHVEQKEPFDVEYRLKTKSGDYKWFQAKGIVSVSPETGVQRMTGSITDIQYRKDAELKLVKYMDELERSNRELDEFAYIASHDLKSPLRGIDQLANWIAEDLEGSLTTETRRNLALMSTRVKRMDRLLSDLLAYSQVGRRKEALGIVDVEVLANDLFSLCSPPEGFSLKVTNDLPRFGTLVAPFEQILRNLINNAIKHHDRDDGVITVGCKPAANDAFYEFFVQDDGPGIDPKYHELVFKMFKSLRPRDEVEGSGIGLALIEKSVKTYGGQVSLASQVGEGTVFSFTWPKKVSDEDIRVV